MAHVATLGKYRYFLISYSGGKVGVVEWRFLTAAYDVIIWNSWHHSYIFEEDLNEINMEKRTILAIGIEINSRCLWDVYFV